MALTTTSTIDHDPTPADDPFQPGRLVISKSHGAKRVLLVSDDDPVDRREEFSAVIVYGEPLPTWKTALGSRGIFRKNGFEAFTGTVTIQQH